MNKIGQLFYRISLLTTLLLGATQVHAELNAGEKIALKQAVVNYIERHTEAGVYNFVDTQTLEVKKMQFLAMHPVLFEKDDGSFAMCADFTTAGDEKFLVDYHVLKVNGQYVVSTAVEGKRSLLMSIAEKLSLD